MRSGGAGHASRGWIGDGYRDGSGTQADVTEVITQARRFTQSPYHAQYQVILSDICRDVSLQDPGDLRIRRRKDPPENCPAVEMFVDALRNKVASVVRARAYIEAKEGTMISLSGGDKPLSLLTFWTGKVASRAGAPVDIMSAADNRWLDVPVDV